MQYKNLIYKLFLVLPLALSCSRDKNHPGYIYYPDMTYSKAYETFSPSPVYADSALMKGPVKGTVSREMVPHVHSKEKESRIAAGAYYINPYEPGDSIMAEGKALFSLICMQCHGEKGNGRGSLFTEGLYPYPPANLLLEKTVNAPDGELYHVGTVGFNLMGAHGSMLRPDERWKVVLYLRSLQGNGQTGRQQSKESTQPANGINPYCTHNKDSYEGKGVGQSPFPEISCFDIFGPSPDYLNDNKAQDPQCKYYANGDQQLHLHIRMDAEQVLNAFSKVAHDE